MRSGGLRLFFTTTTGRPPTQRKQVANFMCHDFSLTPCTIILFDPLSDDHPLPILRYHRPRLNPSSLRTSFISLSPSLSLIVPLIHILTLGRLFLFQVNIPSPQTSRFEGQVFRLSFAAGSGRLTLELLCAPPCLSSPVYPDTCFAPLSAA